MGRILAEKSGSIAGSWVSVRGRFEQAVPLLVIFLRLRWWVTRAYSVTGVH